jgi:menaquinone-9 beta-reductase
VAGGGHRLHPEGALVAGELVRARWVVGADGASSRVRGWAKLDQANWMRPEKESALRFPAPLPRRALDRLHGTALGAPLPGLCHARQPRRSLCGADLVHPKLRLRIDDALGEFPELSARLENAEPASSERGAITVTRRLRRVYRGQTVLVGDASGGVDAITGEGLCLGFRQATLLGDCLASGDLARYQKGHRALLRRPVLMARMMLFMAKHSHLRQRTMQVFQTSPRSFAGMLAMHVGEGCARLTSRTELPWDGNC